MSTRSQPAQTAPTPLALTPEATTTAAAAPVHPTGAAAPAAPVAQIAPALLTLAKTADGSQQMTVRLHPEQLGMVQVRIERATSGLTQIDITADKPETLQALQRDQPALHRTLDEAGIPAAGRTVTFHTVPPAPASSGSSASSQGGGQNAFGSRANNGGTDAGGSAGNGRGGYPARESNRWSGARPPSASPGARGAVAPTRTGTYRIGLDITA